LREVLRVLRGVTFQRFRVDARLLGEGVEVAPLGGVQVDHGSHHRRIRRLVIADVRGCRPELTAGGGERVRVLHVALDDATLAAHVSHLGEFVGGGFFGFFLVFFSDALVTSFRRCVCVGARVGRVGGVGSWSCGLSTLTSLLAAVAVV